jgi:hypothetical protein
MSKPQCNLSASLEPRDFKQMWTTIIQFIFATDMAKHFALLNTFPAVFNSNTYSLEKPEHRMITLQLILKCGDISNVARPFEVPDKWCVFHCEEFFGDKPKLQIGFYAYVCLPLFQATARAVPVLMCNVKQVESNLAIWNQHEIGI